jgi:hypothetical protein
MHVKINFSEGNHKRIFWFLEPFWFQLMFFWVASSHDKYHILRLNVCVCVQI